MRGELATEGGIPLGPVIVLFDSGASGSNYISDSLVKRFDLQNAVEETQSKCRIADGTIVEISGSLRLSLRFVAADGGSSRNLYFSDIEGAERGGNTRNSRHSV